MMKRSLATFMVLAMAFSLSGCKQIIDGFSLGVGENTVTTTANFIPEFGFNVTKSVDIVVKGVKYGTVGVAAPQEGKPFQVYVTADLTIFTSEVWEGFGPVTTLPNGEPLPSWITPGELVRVDIPNFTEFLDLTLYIGYKNPFYVGVAVSLKLFDNRYPDGLSVSQYLKKKSKIWGQGMVYGPAYDDQGNVTQHGGIFFVAGFSKGQILDINIKKTLPEDIIVKLP
ncbi:MAG: hypothetical protein AABY86_14865 [Bdellovibrionota bacterium]